MIKNFKLTVLDTTKCCWFLKWKAYHLTKRAVMRERRKNMNNTKLSNDELIRKLNSLRDTIINDDVKKIVREDDESNFLSDDNKGKVFGVEQM